MPTHTSNRVRLAVGIAVPALAFSVAACSSDDNHTGETVTVTQSAPAAATETVPKTGAPASTATQGPAPKVLLDGTPVQAQFAPSHCEWGEDDGRPQLDFDAGHDDSAGDLDVEINLTAPPTLDDLSLEIGNTEWETTAEDRAGAKVTVDGDTYRVISRVTDDDDSTKQADVAVTFTCSRG
ncbi:lipoprotein LpqH [Gordonia sp. (in: high G+C Gram-positive bacteria)]|uniref:lipoprotein LpqH n=1 Tax=Gordonia sp. (in: high G+C Gram-positive bacteria) TaxID=84139 RepID=UPI0016AEDC09|nr:lipoprotein LpqH [Gordonia sp. (in: high G+C Gram-positive bacteria)]NLG47257.1 hypothetical protein [Gordonia sp. (in: high G+C Gram-positive bacteria)]